MAVTLTEEEAALVGLLIVQVEQHGGYHPESAIARAVEKLRARIGWAPEPALPPLGHSTKRP